MKSIVNYMLIKNICHNAKSFRTSNYYFYSWLKYFCFIPLVYSSSIQAHGFGERYDLPVPLDLYLGGSAIAVLLSFFVIAFFVRGKRFVNSYPRINLISHSGFRYQVALWSIRALRLFAVGIFVLVIVGGLYGQQDPFSNIAPTAIWVIWWVGFAYLAGLFINLWDLVNPWSVIFATLEKIKLIIFPNSPFGLALAWPKKLERWPAVFLFCWFIWAELIWPNSDSPSKLALIVLIYSGVTWLGMWLFGRYVWLENGEIFSIFFKFLGRFSASEYRVENTSEETDCIFKNGENNRCINHLACFEKAKVEDRRWSLRPWAVGLLTNGPLRLSSCIFVLLMLASVTFDGLLATPLWASLAKTMVYAESLRPLIIFIQDYTGNAITAVSTIALVAFIILFISIYLLFNALMWILLPAGQRARHSIMLLARTFVLSLIPIALAYHLAHYLSYLAIVGQYIIPLSSDPLGIGWNLFGTQLYQVDISIIDARFVWFTSVVAIVVGHIIAVWLSHVMALRTFRDNRSALLSQMPMLVLMLGYTILSLWIMAQPVVEI